MEEQKTVVKKCKIEGCKRPYRAKGYCNVHYNKWRRGGLPKPRYKICTAEDCRKPMVRWGLCQAHFEAAKAKGGEKKSE